MNYCSHCGSGDIRWIVPEGDHRRRSVCGECNTIHYSNPRMIVGCLIVRDEKVMLCRRGIEPRKGLWNLPSGFLENGETVQEGAIRETLEETEADVKLIRLHSVFNIPVAQQVYLHFLAKMKGPHYAVTPESTEIAFFAEDEIPWDDLAFSSTRYAIECYYEEGPVQVHIGTHTQKPGEW